MDSDARIAKTHAITLSARTYEAQQNAEQYVPVIVVANYRCEGPPFGKLDDAKAFIRTARDQSGGTVDGFVAVKRVDVIFVPQS